MDTIEIRAVIKYISKKQMYLKEIHYNFIYTLRDESPSYSMVRKWAAEFMRDAGRGGEGGGRGEENVEDYERSGRPKEATKDSRICVTGEEACVI